MKKRILVVAKCNKAEALRVGAGLTLLNDSVQIDVLGGLDNSPAIAEQREILEFAEIPCVLLEEGVAGYARLAEDILQADAAYVI